MGANEQKLALEQMVKEVKEMEDTAFLFLEKSLLRDAIETGKTIKLSSEEKKVIIKAMIQFALDQMTSELSQHIQHPTKPGYNRRDILKRIKELESTHETYNSI